MKKLFVSLMAVAALVSCSKEDDVVMDTQNKSIEITIANGNADTRLAGAVTPAGANGACANAADLKVLFADSEGKILNELPLVAEAASDLHASAGYNVGAKEGDTYVWHNVDWKVTQVAVVRYEAGDFEASLIGQNLSVVSALAENEEKNITRNVEDIVLYGVGGLTDSNETHRIGDVVYHVWTTSVRVAPKFARFEISKLACTDLGANTDASKYSFDELVVGGLTWTGSEGTYEAASFSGKLYGSNNATTSNTGCDPNTETDSSKRSNTMTPASGVWSWNVKPQTFDELVVDLTAYSYSYKLADRDVDLTVTDLKKGENINNTFAAENIYQLDLSFTEKNIIDPEGLCVKVTVTIAPWTVNTVTPVFGK